MILAVYGVGGDCGSVADNVRTQFPVWATMHRAKCDGSVLAVAIVRLETFCASQVCSLGSVREGVGFAGHQVAEERAEGGETTCGDTQAGFGVGPASDTNSSVYRVLDSAIREI